ncbi:Uncharacterised protein [Mycobacteroides abscessus subsp. abscessus]|uniref:hypothetical protein n=1 Tax=Mycobacteroides abscessus TaxID=36809 RepID=UPI000929AD92|nr:hypothetical protein [Mycobacteroides abscessus]SIE58994.1 Uncharacterised protein [Mycobacteroides abscessus subsp. abscessus]SKV27694.1 Uncharacterised protein [Mycobacteroides abscessus subsp. abscessus]
MSALHQFADTSTSLGPSDVLDALLGFDDLYRIAASVPRRQPGTVGRPRAYPAEVALLYCAMAPEYGSHLRAAAEFRNPRIWEHIRARMLSMAGIDLPTRPPSRNQLNYGRKELIRQEPGLADTFRFCAIAQAQRMGLLNPNIPISLTSPARGQFITGDGKVIASPVLRVTATKWTNNAASTFTMVPWKDHKQGGDEGGQWVYGTKFFQLSARPDSRRNIRVILDSRHVPPSGHGGEIGVAMESARRLLRTIENGCVHGLTYDGAATGVHLNELMKRGLLCVVPTPKNVATKALHRIACRCGRSHDLWTEHGQISLRRIDDSGAAHLLPLTAKLTRHANKDGTWRWYAVLNLPCGNTHRERIDTTPKDTTRGFNRAHQIRQAAIRTTHGTTLKESVYGWRSDSESGNRVTQNHLKNRQVAGYSAESTTLLMLCMAITRNAIAHAVFEQSHPPPGQPLAA